MTNFMYNWYSLNMVSYWSKLESWNKRSNWGRL